MLSVTEIFPTIQGEGHHAGTCAVFCRLAGCNLWSGKEKDRENAVCKFCDTQFDVRLRMTEDELVKEMHRIWKQKFGEKEEPFFVFTGGEPALQVTESLLRKLKSNSDCYIAMESNGTVKVSLPSLDWLCISPKAGSILVQRTGNELKVVWPQLFDLDDLAKWEFSFYFLQPMDSPEEVIRQHNITRTIAMVMSNPFWQISVQTHKILQLP